jgi:hypothetical protein
MIVASCTLTPTSMTVVATIKNDSPVRKALHRRLTLSRRHAAVNDLDALAEERLQLEIAIKHRREIDSFALLDQRAHPVRALAAFRRFSDAVDDFAHARSLA